MTAFCQSARPNLSQEPVALWAKSSPSSQRVCCHRGFLLEDRRVREFVLCPKSKDGFLEGLSVQRICLGLVLSCPFVLRARSTNSPVFSGRKMTIGPCLARSKMLACREVMDVFRNSWDAEQCEYRLEPTTCGVVHCSWPFS